MRVLVLTADHPPHTWSGIGTAVASQAEALHRLTDVEVSVLVPEPTDDRWRSPVRPEGFDLVHLHSLALSELALELRRRFALPLVYTAHSLLHLELAGLPQAAVWERVQAAVMRASDHVIFLSPQERAAALARHPELAGRCSVVANGVEPPSRQHRPRPSPDLPIVFAGRFTQAKGITLLAAIVRGLAGTRGYRFVLAGGHGDVAGQAVAAELADRFPAACQVMGWLTRPMVDDLLARARLVLVPSRYEPFGMVALEAMRQGTPVLAAAVGGLPAVVTDESGGRMVGSRDPSAWCASIVELLESPTLHQELSRRGPPYVAHRYDPARLAAGLRDDIYRPLARRRPERTGGSRHARR
jgi:glycosyltransferase involved in cell wall biosynthesis